MSDIVSLLIIGAGASISVCTFSCLGTLAPLFLADGHSFRAGVRESALFMSGKILLYAALGAGAAWTGSQLPPSFLYYFAPLSGLFLILVGLYFRFGKGTQKSHCHASRKPIFDSAKRLWARPSLLVMLGLVTSLMPCPAVLSLLTISSNAGSPLMGFSYGLSYGTGLLLSPVLIAGGGLSVIGRALRLQAMEVLPWVRTIASVVIVLAGIRIVAVSL